MRLSIYLSLTLETFIFFHLFTFKFQYPCYNYYTFTYYNLTNICDHLDRHFILTMSERFGVNDVLEMWDEIPADESDTDESSSDDGDDLDKEYFPAGDEVDSSEPVQIPAVSE